MPLNETPEQRKSRRDAVRTICRLSTALDSPNVLSKDAGAAVLADRVSQLRQAAQRDYCKILTRRAALKGQTCVEDLEVESTINVVFSGQTS